MYWMYLRSLAFEDEKASVGICRKSACHGRSIALESDGQM